MPSLTPPVAASGASTDPEHWRRLFDEPATLTVGIEEELMLLDAATLDLVPGAAQLAQDAGDDDRIRTELPAAQLELVTRAAPTVGAALAELRELRTRAAGLADARGQLLAGAGAHPFAASAGPLTEGPRYERIGAEYGPVARRQLVYGLHVHVCLRGADRVLAVYDALREYLPTLAALAANAPLYEGADCGLASVRPLIGTLLPRQGVPPAFGSWEAVAAAHAWGQSSGRVPEPASWWWEARLHPEWGTLEIRVPDAQTTIAEAAAVAATAHALVAWLAARHDAGELSAPAETWRIAENRWSACRHGLDARLADVRTGATAPAREVLAELLDALAPFARGLGCVAELEAARALARQNGSQRLRDAAADGDVHAATAWLAQRFTA